MDKNWDNLRYREKYAVWEYTQNSNPINKSLSGYHDGWRRSRDFVGLGKTNLGHEDNWRHFQTIEFKNKFAVDGHKDYKSVVQNLTNGIEKTELQNSMVLFRGSDKKALAGWFEQSPGGFKGALEILQNGTEEEMKQVFVGQIGTNHAFTSTGIASDAGFSGNVSFEIFAPAGTKGIYAEPVSYYGNTISGEEIYKTGKTYSSGGTEAEIILQRGTSFRITDIEKIGSRINVKCEIIDQPDYFKTGLEMTHNGGETLWQS